MERTALVVEPGPGALALAEGESLARVASADDALARIAATEGAVDVLLLGPGVEDPFEVAQRAHLLDRDLAVVIAADPERQAQMERALEFAPFLGEDVVVLPAADGAGLARGLAAAGERVRARRALHVGPRPRADAPPAEQVLGQLLAEAPLGVAVVDGDGVVIGWNRRAGEILGAGEEEPVGSPLAALFPAHEAGRLAGLVRRAAAGETPPGPTTFRRDPAPGRVQRVAVTVGPLTGRAGEAGAMVVLRDVTAEALAEEERRAMQEALQFQKTLLESQSDASREGTLVVGPDGAVLSFNRRFAELWGVDGARGAAPDEAARGALAAALAGPDAFLARLSALAADAEADTREELALADGRTFDAYSAPVKSDAGVHYGRVWFFRDVTEGKEEEARLRFLADATEMLAESLEYEKTLGRVARLAVPRLADWFIIDELREDGTIARVAVAAASPAKQAVIDELGRLYPPTWDSPQPAARALREGKTVMLEFADEASLRATARDERHLRLVAELAPRSTVALPLVAHGRTLGVATFSFSESGRSYAEPDVALAEAVARRAALALDRARVYRAEQEARVAAEAARERGAFLAEVTELLSSSLDFGETLNRIASLAVPRLADWCIVYGVGDDGRIRRLAVQHVDRDTSRDLEARLERFRLDPEADEAVPKVIRTREPEFHPDASLELLAADVDEPERFVEVLEELRPTSWMCLPLVSRGDSLGAISFFTTVSGRRYDEGDLALAQEVARRAALAVDQTRVHRAEQRARRAAEAARERLAFVAEASAVLASSLDVAATLARVARLAAGRLADWCVVCLREGDDVRLLAVAHREPEREVALRELHARYPVRLDDPTGLTARVLRTGKPVLAPEVTDEVLASATRGPEDLDLARRVGFGSLLAVPVLARDDVLGSIALATAEAGRLGPDDLAIAEDLAARAALAVENARLFAEAEARAQAARALATVGDGVVLVDARGIVRLWNPAAEAITGLPAGDVLGRPAEEAIPGWPDVARLVEIGSGPGPGGSRPQTVPIDLRGREAWLSFTGVGFGDGTVYTFRDLTEERHLEELKTDFVATASHELRTPLAAVYGAAMTLRRPEFELDDERRNLLLSVIADESDRLARIVNDILWASRVDTGEAAVEIAPFDPREAARRVVEAAHLHIASGVQLELVAPERLPLVAADEQKVSQVLANLVDNAIKYSPDGGRVELSLEPADGKLRFVVRDEGLGIPAKEQARIFEKFYRLDPNLTRGVGGTGLGLYICRELVRRMNGRIWVASREGEGSTFSVELPLAERQAAS